jgi:hypothetical protein
MLFLRLLLVILKLPVRSKQNCYLLRGFTFFDQTGNSGVFEKPEAFLFKRR